MNTMSKKALQGLKLAFSTFREFTDPAWEGSPYSTELFLTKSVEVKKMFSFRKKFALR